MPITSSKHTTAVYNRYQRISARIRDLYSSTRIFRLTAEEYSRRMCEILQSPDYLKLTQYYKGKVSGLTDSLWSSLYSCGYDGDKSPLMSVSFGPDRRMFPQGDDSWLAEDDTYKLTLKCEHIWRFPYESKGEVRPWSYNKGER